MPNFIVTKLQCNSSQEQDLIEQFVTLAERDHAEFKSPIPWKRFRCTDDKVVFLAHTATEVLGWALCYINREMDNVYLASISTKAAKNPTQYRGVGTQIMETINTSFPEFSYLFLLPVKNSHGFYKRFGFAEFGSSHLLFKPITRSPTKTEVLWYDSQDDLTLMIMELEEYLPSEKLQNIESFMSMKNAKKKHTVFKKVIDIYRDGDLQRLADYLTPKL